MLILAFDCSGPACSVTLWRDGMVMAAERELMERGQAEALMPMIDRVMKAGGAGYGDLARIAVTVGPGSFTGVRAGLAAARGLTLASQVRTVGVLTTTALVAAVPDAERRDAARILAAIDTRRGDLYVQLFLPDGSALDVPEAMAPEALPVWIGPGQIRIVGDGGAAALRALEGRAACASTGPLVDTAILAALGTRVEPQAGGPTPVYVHPPAVTPPSP